MRAIAGRPVLMQRYPQGATGPSFFQKRVPKNAPEWLRTRSSRHRTGRRPTRWWWRTSPTWLWAVNLGCLGLPRVAVGRGRPGARRRAAASTSTRCPGTTFGDGRARPPPSSRALLDELGMDATAQDDGQPRASTSTCGSRPSRTPTGCARRRSPWHASSSAADPTWSRTRGGRRSAATGCSSTSTRTRRTRRSSGRGRCARGPAGRCRRRSSGTSSRRSHQDVLTLATVPDRVAADGDPWDHAIAEPQPLAPLLELHERDMRNGPMDAPWPPVYPKMPNEPPRVAPSRARKPSRTSKASADWRLDGSGTGARGGRVLSGNGTRRRLCVPCRAGCGRPGSARKARRPEAPLPATRPRDVAAHPTSLTVPAGASGASASGTSATWVACSPGERRRRAGRRPHP